MQRNTFFMRDQVKHRVSSIMTERHHVNVPSEMGAPALAALVALLTILNILAVLPAA